ncbi:NCS2 family permease [Craterilacuibacter sinensis]|uniref:NCS2 family permease n=1 Tax=Craterilacuibacter sinensis TaxID=2686017 RepID=A0A845BIF5_9NEIS|nr:NCS2 family permease [Craterilacuibacter sinensis]MXR36065.1 NCS2 family permease [Craterilacuibacter sinensis]
MLEKLFHIRAQGSSVRTEILAGFTTFLTMSAILFVNPDILAAAGMDHGAVFVATCLAGAIGCLLMGLLANYPIGQGPGMGINAFFAFGLVKGMGLPWETALGAVFLSGILFILVSLFKVREWFVNAIPACLKHSISAGVGLFISLIALQQAGIVVASPDTMLALGPLGTPSVLLAAFGFLLMVVLDRRGVPGAIIIGILTVTAISVALGYTPYGGIVSAPPSLAPTFLKADILAALHPAVLGVVLSFFLMSLFETSGTLIAIAERGNFLDKDGHLPRLKRALLADSTAISAGALLGTSSTTSYIESTTGIAAGGRTGLAAVVIAGLFIAALVFAPLAAMVPGYATAPALLYVAILMLRSLTHLEWDELTETAPAIACITTMAFTFSIADGIAFGAITYVITKLATGQGKQLSLPIVVIAGLFIARYLFL